MNSPSKSLVLPGNRQKLPFSFSAPSPLRARFILLSLGVCVGTQATDGYFSSGYGIKSKGRAGVALTATDDAFSGANNPATLNDVSDRLDAGIDWFRPDRSAERTGPATPLNAAVESDRGNFFIPEFAYKRALNDSIAYGVSVYGNGGMNTDYAAGQLNLGPGQSGKNILAGTGHLGVNLVQVLISPTLSFRLSENHSIGIAPTIGYQRFKAYGLDAFSALSQDPSALTNRGADDSWGAGARIGYLWHIVPEFSLGAVYSSRVYASGFDKYRGLFADDGSFDIPQSIGFGLGWQVTSSIRVASDYKWIDNESIQGVGNSSSNLGALGQKSGPGFGWKSIHVIKAGVDWAVTPSTTLRAGYGYAENPVQSEDVTFNILAPGIVQHHVSAGATFSWEHHEVSLAYTHAFENSVRGQSKFVDLGLAPAGTVERISMSQDSIGLAYSYKF